MDQTEKIDLFEKLATRGVDYKVKTLLKTNMEQNPKKMYTMTLCFAQQASDKVYFVFIRKKN